MAKDNEVQLGDIAKDTVTGFKGVVIGVTKWLHGCRRISIQPQDLKDGKPIDHVSFDEPQIEVLQRAKFETTSKTGGPHPEPTRPNVPSR